MHEWLRFKQEKRTANEQLGKQIKEIHKLLLPPFQNVGHFSFTLSQT